MRKREDKKKDKEDKEKEDKEKEDKKHEGKKGEEYEDRSGTVSRKKRARQLRSGVNMQEQPNYRRIRPRPRHRPEQHRQQAMLDEQEEEIFEKQEQQGKEKRDKRQEQEDAQILLDNQCEYENFAQRRIQANQMEGQFEPQAQDQNVNHHQPVQYNLDLSYIYLVPMFYFHLIPLVPLAEQPNLQLFPVGQPVQTQQQHQAINVENNNVQNQQIQVQPRTEPDDVQEPLQQVLEPMNTEMSGPDRISLFDDVPSQLQAQQQPESQSESGSESESQHESIFEQQPDNGPKFLDDVE